MILSDRDIKFRLQNGDLDVSPIDDLETQLQPASLDIRLKGEEMVVLQQGENSKVHPWDQGDFTLTPDRLYLGATIEKVSIPGDVVAKLEGRSSIGRMGLQIHATAGYIDPGFEGSITLEIKNLAHYPVSLTPGMRIAQLTFVELTSEVESLYAGKYQGQIEPTSSRIDQEMP